VSSEVLGRLLRQPGRRICAAFIVQWIVSGSLSWGETWRPARGVAARPVRRRGRRILERLRGAKGRFAGDGRPSSIPKSKLRKQRSRRSYSGRYSCSGSGLGILVGRRARGSRSVFIRDVVKTYQGCARRRQACSSTTVRMIGGDGAGPLARPRFSSERDHNGSSRDLQTS